MAGAACVTPGVHANMLAPAFGTTLFDVHRYIITMCYDTVHVSGMVLAGIILASGEKVSPRAGMPPRVVGGHQVAPC